MVEVNLKGGIARSPVNRKVSLEIEGISGAKLALSVNVL